MDINIKWGTENLGVITYTPITHSTAIDLDISRWPKVKNEVRCYLLHDGQRFRRIPFNHQLDIIRVAIITESPHKDEFTDYFYPIRPLNGLSGLRFNRYIEKKMREWFCNNDKKE